MKKKIILKLCNAIPFAILFCFLLFTFSCKKDSGSNDTQHIPPSISSVVNLSNRDISLVSVNYGDWIIIKGKNLATTYKVDFNTVLASDSLIYADDTTVTVKIPATLPDPADNPITVTTKYGTATYNFKILQPAPVISSFDPVAGPSGTEVTIKGLYFGGVTSVKFGTTAATIISSTKTEIKVTVPAGVNYGYIYVTTQSGTTVSDKTFGFQYLIYDDAITTGWSSTSFSCTTVLGDATFVKRGTKSIKNTCTSTFGAFRVTKSAALSLSGYTALKFSVYVAAAYNGKKIKVYINGVTASGYTIVLTGDTWNDIQIPLSNLGNPATVTTVTLQEFSGVKQEFYVDDIGFI